jgi:hypothetical protein
VIPVDSPSRVLSIESAHLVSVPAFEQFIGFVLSQMQLEAHRLEVHRQHFEKENSKMKTETVSVKACCSPSRSAAGAGP